MSTETITMTFATERWNGRKWVEVCRFNFNPIDKLARLPNQQFRRVVDLTTGATCEWAGATVGYRPKEVARG